MRKRERERVRLCLWVCGCVHVCYEWERKGEFIHSCRTIVDWKWKSTLRGPIPKTDHFNGWIIKFFNSKGDHLIVATRKILVLVTLCKYPCLRKISKTKIKFMFSRINVRYRLENWNCTVSLVNLGLQIKSSNIRIWWWKLDYN